MSARLKLEEEPWQPDAPFAVYYEDRTLAGHYGFHLVRRFATEADGRAYCEAYSKGGRIVASYEITGT